MSIAFFLSTQGLLHYSKLCASAPPRDASPKVLAPRPSHLIGRTSPELKIGIGIVSGNGHMTSFFDFDTDSDFDSDFFENLARQNASPRQSTIL